MGREDLGIPGEYLGIPGEFLVFGLEMLMNQ
jgi:hypothetical protein